MVVRTVAAMADTVGTVTDTVVATADMVDRATVGTVADTVDTAVRSVARRVASKG